MTLEPISSVASALQNDKVLNNKNSNNKNIFDDILKKSTDEVNKSLNLANEQMENIIQGSDEDFHKYLINAQKTEISLQLTMQVRNKVVDAYEEIMRMQV